MVKLTTEFIKEIKGGLKGIKDEEDIRGFV